MAYSKKTLLLGSLMVVFGVSGALANLTLHRDLGLFLYICMAILGVIVLIEEIKETRIVSSRMKK